MMALQCTDLSVALSGHPVLHDIDLQLPAGRWTAVVGPNGAGKSTLLRGLSGLVAPSAGEVRLLGRPVARWSAAERARTLAWLGQLATVPDDWRVWDVVMLGRLPHQPWWGSPGPADQAAVEQALQDTGTSAWRQRTLGSLSGGERQRVLLARALAVQAPVCLMDEPLAHLDPPHQADWWALVRRLVARGQTVLSVLHELPWALLADDLLVMQGGQVVHHGPCDDPRSHRALEAVFDHRIEVLPAHGQWLVLPRTRFPVEGAQP